MSALFNMVLPHMEELAVEDLKKEWGKFAGAVKAMDNVFKNDPRDLSPFLTVPCLLSHQIAMLHIAQAFYSSVQTMKSRQVVDKTDEKPVE